MKKLYLVLIFGLVFVPVASAQAAMQSLNGLSPQNQTFSSDGTISITSSGSNHAFTVAADSIGDAQLAFNTGQHLTVSSAVNFASITLSSATDITTVTDEDLTLVANGTGVIALNDTISSSSLAGGGTQCLQVNNAGVISGAGASCGTPTGILPVANGGTGANTLADLITLGTHTTGNYVATIADSGSGVITVNNSGSESAAVTLGITADSIGDTQLAFNTGQHLTTTSDVQFASLALSSPLSLSSGGTNANVGSFSPGSLLYFDGTKVAEALGVSYDAINFNILFKNVNQLGETLEMAYSDHISISSQTLFELTTSGSANLMVLPNLIGLYNSISNIEIKDTGVELGGTSSLLEVMDKIYMSGQVFMNSSGSSIELTDTSLDIASGSSVANFNNEYIGLTGQEVGMYSNDGLVEVKNGIGVNLIAGSSSGNFTNEYIGLIGPEIGLFSNDNYLEVKNGNGVNLGAGSTVANFTDEYINLSSAGYNFKIDNLGFSIDMPSFFSDEVKFENPINRFESSSQSTMYVGNNGIPGCLAIGDSDSSGITYVTVNNGSISSSSTKPATCD